MALSKQKVESDYQVIPSKKQVNEDIIASQQGYLIIKRSIDILGSLIGLILLFPVFLIVSILIKIEDSKGTVLFKQVRVGKNEKTFTMYKFRSMVSNAEELLEDLLDQNETTGAMFKMKDDPRVTKIGKFIRKTSIDELPQLLNVLKGDMSLVGPRPPLVREVKEYTEYQKQRLLIKPGCTGLWQVNGRSNVGFEKMVELDLKYIKTRSIKVDSAIVIKTIFVILNNKDAY
ncbi:sugar transferase [Terrilactibacillus sp. BCM23-1]|uniref:Sugar transferase n=1 Tax=Terrilactibacillus tamarindi TaxID=2599694 RepID=A0A6N8CV90_9BACI|nr:sugar transferase [Terrilactibacillus tamarindi]MTT32156.1 sugar transferase [Terrilactibacillus tamarindi]